MKFLTIAVIASFLACLAFTVVCIVLGCLGYEVSDTLIQWFFTVFGVEFSCATAIKISKHLIKKQEMKDKIDELKKEGLEIEKSDITNDLDDNYNFDSGGDYYG